MTVAVHLADRLVRQTLSQFLLKMGNVRMVATDTRSANGVAPDVLLVDSASLRQELLIRHPAAKILLLDTGIPREKLCATLLAYRIHGVVSLNTGSHNVKKALQALGTGQSWSYHGSVKTYLTDTVTIVTEGKVNGITDRQQEIVQRVCQGLSNGEIAQQFGLSENTVKSHLNRIFKKLHVRSRSKLITLAMQSPLRTSA